MRRNEYIVLKILKLKSSILLLVLLTVLCSTCSRKLEKRFISSADDLTSTYQPTSKLTKYKTCNNPEAYIPYPSLLSQFPLRIIRVNVHFMNNLAKDQNYDGQEAKEYSKGLVENANYRLQINHQMRLPEGNKTPALHPRYEYRLTGSSSNKQGVYTHYDEELYYFINKGKKQNNYKRAVINKYAIDMDSVLNIFIMPHHPDSLKSKTYHIPVTGIALGNAVKLAVQYESTLNYSKYGALLNHEIGHVMGLMHSWNSNDGCDDTPKNENCWGQTEYPPCNKLTSNNIMDYNNSQMAISPCQIGTIHRNLSRLNSKQRKTIVKNWCAYEKDKSIEIDRLTIWDGAKDLQGDLVIKNNASLEIKCRVAMSNGAQIIVEPGGELILNNAHLHNDCNENWKGITYYASSTDSSAVQFIGNVTIDNVAESSIED